MIHFVPKLETALGMESVENVWTGGREEHFEKFYFQGIISVQLFGQDFFSL